MVAESETRRRSWRLIRLDQGAAPVVAPVAALALFGGLGALINHFYEVAKSESTEKVVELDLPTLAKNLKGHLRSKVTTHGVLTEGTSTLDAGVQDSRVSSLNEAARSKKAVRLATSSDSDAVSVILQEKPQVITHQGQKTTESLTSILARSTPDQVYTVVGEVVVGEGRQYVVRVEKIQAKAA